MKYYKWDEDNLIFVTIRHYYKHVITILSIGIIVLMGVIVSMKFEKKLIYSEIRLILLKEDEFSEEKLIKMINDLNFEFPEIVYAQAILETDHFHSKIFIENKNLFGMREAYQRITTANSSQYEYAYYSSWKESVYDYALYSASYIGKLGDLNKYFDYLAQSYAEDPLYVEKLRNIIKQENLNSKFN